MFTDVLFMLVPVVGLFYSSISDKQNVPMTKHDRNNDNGT